MIKSFGFIALAMVLGTALSMMLMPQSAQAATFSSSNVNMRAGPGVHYARIGVVPRGRRVHVGRCTHGGWCRVSFHRRAGWVSSAYLTSHRANQRDSHRRTVRRHIVRRPAIRYRSQIRRRAFNRPNRRGFQLYIGQRPAFRRLHRRPPPPFYVYFGR